MTLSDLGTVTRSRLSVLLAPGIFPPDSGGPATFAPQLGADLADRGHTIRVVTNGTAPTGFDDQYSFDIDRIPRKSNVLVRYTTQIRTLRTAIRSFDPDIVLTNAFDLQTIAATRFLRVPVVTKIVGDNAWERARRSRRVTDDIDTFQDHHYSLTVAALKTLRTIQTRSADHVVVPSEYLRSLVSGWGVSHRNISVIHNAVNVDRSAVSRDTRKPWITTACRLVPWKGVGGLIEAFAAVGNRLPDAELHVVGKGPERSSLEAKAAATDVADRIVFHGQISHDEVLHILAKSQVFALNSTYEGLPHVVLEAMTCGTPVVASRTGGTPEVVEDRESGYLVPQDDTAAFADRFECLLTDPSLRATFRDSGYRLLEERFDYREMIESYDRLLMEIATNE